jgi:PBP superfamily domain
MVGPGSRGRQPRTGAAAAPDRAGGLLQRFGHHCPAHHVDGQPVPGHLGRLLPPQRRNLTPCGFTSFYPLDPGMEAKAQSQGVSGFVAQDSSEGAITYVEYSYARNAGFPVAKVLNKANYYVEPTAGSVAVALLKAQIHQDLTQDLSQVYVDTDPRTYPLSSYSYMIIPKDTSPGSRFNAEKGRTLSEFAAYFLCEGQQQADILGYSPLPINLVQVGVDQINQIPGSTKRLDRNNLPGATTRRSPRTWGTRWPRTRRSPASVTAWEPRSSAPPPPVGLRRRRRQKALPTPAATIPAVTIL